MKTTTKIIAFAVAAVAIFFTTNVSAQNLGIGADLGIPTNKAYKFAGGLDARIQFNITKQLAVPITTGYTRFWAKDRFNSVFGYNTPDYAYIPLKTGLKYYFSPSGSGAYVLGEVGTAFGVSRDSKTTFLYSPSVGYALGSGLDIGIKYENAGNGDALRFLGGHSHTGQFALRIAYGF